MDTKTCPKCGACWIGGQHFWSGTNKKGDETQLASLCATEWVTIRASTQRGDPPKVMVGKKG